MTANGEWATAKPRFDSLILAILLLAVPVGACQESLPDPEGEEVSLRLRPRPAIGSHIGEGPKAFGRIGDFAVADDRSVYVLDQLNRVVQVFDERGNHVRSIGREGNGPGEFANPVALTWDPEGRLWVVDPGNNRYSVFSADGELIRTYPRPVQGVVGDWPGGFSPDGRLYDVAFEFGPGGPVEVLVECAVTEEEVTPVRRIELPDLERTTFPLVERPGNIAMEEVPFASQPIWRIGPDGHLWYARTGEPWVYRRSLEDGTEQRFGREFEAPPVSRQERQAAIDGLARFLEIAGEVDLSVIPETKPHLRGFFFDDDQNLWIMRSFQYEPGNDAWPMDVWDPEGNLLGTVRGTLEATPWPKVGDGLVAGLMRVASAIEFVALYEVW
jgi:sugar lactone lactonase YvrE